MGPSIQLKNQDYLNFVAQYEEKNSPRKSIEPTNNRRAQQKIEKSEPFIEI